MKDIFKNIDQQIQFNEGKNLFANGQNSSLRFIQETILFCSKPNKISAEAEDVLVEYTVNKVLNEFYRINQYYTFSNQAVEELRQLYKKLFSEIRNSSQSVNAISDAHYNNLRNWLTKTNPFAAKINIPNEETIEAVACSEYSEAFQLNVLRIDAATLMQPLLDIGCGKDYSLVKHLRKNGIDAYGIDRFPSTEVSIAESDWLLFDYGVNKWGTITSHLGFSNHFRHHHFRQDGNFIEYAKTYMQILASLKIGGCFHYAPDLPFIEEFLDEESFNVSRMETGNSEFQSVIVQRLK
ncbi:MAG: hypothetical protein A2W93_12410 [Bacteroidetes bacterium GWF2_43_63]|nr:MAG: hypothetical protein A2W94_06905 [Bacteroidetes bacterium GWE2_42_42]OFY56468.1 MAG: hypothetical protein A2W93_12410 [Bacteroidetes bacterium GWF2_43_63]HBG71186.1 class I SAM-dependent methyltransferase [Bacteroidales bacterium]HCB61269.1 class I SAM-dependent methyltransferase [Bacteroidales bacterium]HCY23286.1 class I SAM-dependent methyltransferase [Bacteroidales bacterium]